MLAQYTGEESEGFYRIKNNGAAKRYITIVNDKVDNNFKKFTVNDYKTWRAVNALTTVKDPTNDPGSILYISGNTSDLSLKGQGMDTSVLLGSNYKLMKNGSQLCSEYKGTMVFMTDNYDADNNKNATVGIGLSSIAKEAGTYASWEFVKIDNEKEYFGITPEIELDNKYYTTLFTSFAYQLSDGMKAYYVNEHEYQTDKITEPLAVLTEVPTNQIPAGTPVIIECISNKPSDNKLIPLKSSSSTIKNNELIGIYFCYIKYSFDDVNRGESETDAAKELKNVIEYDAQEMRVLGTVDGKLALTVANDKQIVVTNKGKYLPANKAYLPIKYSESSITQKGIKLVDKKTFDDAITAAAAIRNINNNEVQTTSGVFTLTGTRIKSDNSTEGLANGIYIINGKKVIIK